MINQLLKSTPARIINLLFIRRHGWSEWFHKEETKSALAQTTPKDPKQPKEARLCCPNSKDDKEQQIRQKTSRTISSNMDDCKSQERQQPSGFHSPEISLSPTLVKPPPTKKGRLYNTTLQTANVHIQYF